MTITEAAQATIANAELRGRAHLPRIIALQRAVKIMQPRAERMRERLDFHRARRAGTPKLPTWMAP